MIKRIQINGFSLLRNVQVDLAPGLTVLTGESGAGKSLLFDAVAFALGGRSHRTLLADGVKRCDVALLVELDATAADRLGHPWQAGDNTVERRYTESGRSRIQLNGQPVAVAAIQAAGEQLFEITGQFESRVLFNPASHLELLEAFADTKLAGLRRDYQVEYSAWRETCARLTALRESTGQRDQEIDYLRFQVAELTEAGVEAGERDEVAAQLRVLENAESLKLTATTAAQLLDGDEDSPGAYDLSARAETNIAELSRLLDGVSVELVDPDELTELAADILERLRELAGRCRDLAEAIQHDPPAISRLRERLDELQRLERKYGCTAEELPGLLTDRQRRLDVLTDDTQSPEVLEQRAAAGEQAVRGLAKKLTALRKTAAKRVEESTAGYFSRLDFPQVELQVDLGQLAQPGSDGLDTVEFLISLNPGEPARPLARVASGGEASRLLLGMKASLAERLGYSALLLDEIEAGVGGETARRVADVLTELAAGRQVLAITHLPAVAATGRAHLVAEKQVSSGHTAVDFRQVEGAERRGELARMLGDKGGAEEAALVDKLLAGQPGA